MPQPDLLADFLEKHRLPGTYAAMAEEYFLPLAEWLGERRKGDDCLLVGINGAQGTGKTTLADLLSVVLEARQGWNVVTLSLDDFYLTRTARDRLATQRHPLFLTRGVPGTHETDLLEESLRVLRQLGDGETFATPRFDKSIDDRMDPPWPETTGPVDMIILEGWCVGTPPQSAAELADPINGLEREKDPDGTWREYVNECLATDYAEIFGLLDELVVVRAPSFDAIYRWRLEQENKLAQKVGADAPGLMDAEQVLEFIAYYERLTRHNLATLGDLADVEFILDEAHGISECRYRE